MSRKSTLSAESLAVLKFIQQHGASTLDVLLAAFEGVPRTAMGKRLTNLADLGWLNKTLSSTGQKSWSLHASVVGKVDQVEARGGGRRPAKRKAAPVTPAPGTVAEPRRFSFKEGIYVPRAIQAIRPGSLDFQRVASVGNRC